MITNARYNDKPHLILSQLNHFNDNLLTLSETVDLFINMSYDYMLSPFNNILDIEFCDEFIRQAQPDEVLMIYLDVFKIDSDSWPFFIAYIEAHPHFKSDIFLLQKFYSDSDIYDFCDSDGRLQAAYIVREFQLKKEHVMIKYLQEYLHHMDGFHVEEVSLL